MKDREKLLTICDKLSDFLYGDKSGWKYVKFEDFVSEYSQKITKLNKHTIWNLTEEDPPPKIDYYLTKYLNYVPDVLFYNGKTWGKTGRPDIPNDKVGAPMWWLPLTDDPENM